MYGPPLSDSDDDYDGFSFGDRINKKETHQEHFDEDALCRIAIQEDDLNKLIALLNNISDIDRPVCGSTLLGLACREGSLEIVKYLLDKNAQPNARVNSLTPLIEACANTNQDSKVTQIVELLLNAGAFINVPDNYGTTAFMFACKNGHTDVVKILIKDVSIEASDRDGWTPLFHAIENNRSDIVELLLNHGFDGTLTDKRGYSPRQVAESHGFNDIAEMLPKEKEPPYRVSMKYLSYNDIYDMIPRIFLKSEYPEYFQEINAILTNMGLDYLLEYFEKGKVSLAEFLTISDNRLEEIGVELPINRAKLQKAVLYFHLHHWTKQSIALLRKHTSENFYDVLVLTANHVQNLVIINSSLRYVKNNLAEKSLGNISAESIQSLRENLKNYRAAIKRLKIITKHYNSLSPSRSPLFISYPEYLAKKRKDKLRKWLRYTIFFGVTAVICLKVKKVF